MKIFVDFNFCKGKKRQRTTDNGQQIFLLGFVGNMIFLFCNEYGSENIYIFAILKSGCSSVGRAKASQALGRGFEPRYPLFFLHVNYYQHHIQTTRNHILLDRLDRIL